MYNYTVHTGERVISKSRAEDTERNVDEKKNIQFSEIIFSQIYDTNPNLKKKPKQNKKHTQFPSGSTFKINKVLLNWTEIWD